MSQANHPKLWKKKLPRRTRKSHKYDFGHAVIFGAPKMTGATRLAAEACARIGAGITTVIAPKGTGNIYRRTLKPHVIIEDFKTLAVYMKDHRRNTVLIGPGGGKNFSGLRRAIKAAVAANKNIVIDADGLNALAPFRTKIEAILTPHEMEFKRLFPTLKGSRIVRAKAAAKVSGCVVVLKGAETVIADPSGRVVVNKNAPPWLATAGTGDVLAGMITGLVAQGMEPFWAACAGVWIHGQAAKKHGPGLVATDLEAFLPSLLKILA